MNQILQTYLKDKSYKSNIKKNLKIQLYFSILLILFIIGTFIYKSIKISKQEKYSKQILENYNIIRIYSNLSSINTETDSSSSKNNITSDKQNILGTISIPKLNIQYPVFSNFDNELLKISPCRFFGPNFGENGNICIAGHNYDNNKFFSNITFLNVNDEIHLSNSSNKVFYYYINKIYEVKPDDLSPIYSYDNSKKQLTLVTCNNRNNNRIIVISYIKQIWKNQICILIF